MTGLFTACQANDKIEVDRITSQPELPISSISLTKDGYLFVLERSGDLLRLAHSASPIEIATPDRDITAISFISRDIGWLLTRFGKLFFTDDAGSNWSLLVQLNNQFSGSVTGQFEFVDINNGWLIQRFGVLKTTDGGKSWREITRTSDYSLKTVAQPTFIFPVDGSMAWIGLTGGGILKVNNQGAVLSDLELKNDDISVVFALDDGFCWVGTGNANGLFFTADGGGSWKQLYGKNVSERYSISSVYFKDSQYGWVAGTKLTTNTNEVASTHSLLLRTKDSGKNWHHIDNVLGVDESPTVIRFSDNENGWLVTDRSILQSNDGGNSWSRVFRTS